MGADSISFPHLRITLQHVGRFITIGSFSFTWYGIVLAVAMVSGIWLAVTLARRTGQDEELYFNFAILAIILSVLGARIYYVIFTWDYYSAHPLEILNIRGGGLAIYGGIITALITAAVYCRIKKLDTAVFFDIGIIPLALGQMIGRWGNFFNREAFGEYTDSLLAMRLPLEAVAPEDVTARMQANTVQIDGTVFIQVHPTFLYESLWNLALVLLMLLMLLRWKRRPKGLVFLTYLTGYGIGRFWIEGLRTDQLLIPGTAIAVSQLLSLILAVTGTVLIIILISRNKGIRGTEHGNK